MGCQDARYKKSVDINKQTNFTQFNNTNCGGQYIVFKISLQIDRRVNRKKSSAPEDRYTLTYSFILTTSSSSMSVSGNNLFMLEVIVNRVTLTDQAQIHNTCPVCVCFRLPDLVELVICEGGFCTDGKVGGGEILMANGKACLLTVSTEDLCRISRNFCAIISVNRRVLGEQEMRYVAQTKLEFNRTFVDVILNPNQEQRARKLKRVTYIFRVVLI